MAAAAGDGTGEGQGSRIGQAADGGAGTGQGTGQGTGAADGSHAPRLARFAGIHPGERAVLVCNGPSLNRMDLTRLRGETVIGLNKIHLGLERFGFELAYLVAVNPRVVAQAAAEIAALPVPRFIGARAAAHLPQDAFTFHVPVLSAPVLFSTEPTRGFREGGTVTHAALQVAYWMGFAEVVIVGMDHRFAYQGAPHEARRMEGPDPNHFSPDYFRGQIWDNPDLARSEASYAEARRVYEAAGRRILDATPGGACQVFEKADYEALFPPA